MTTGLRAVDALLSIALDLTSSLGSDARYRRLLSSVGQVVPYDAASLLRLRDGVLVPVAIQGLSPDTLGRRFVPDENPRFAVILGSRTPVRFAADDERPDPPEQAVEDGETRTRPRQPTVPLRDAVAAFKRDLVADAVHAADGNWSAAARNLGMHRSNLHRPVRKLGIKQK